MYLTKCSMISAIRCSCFSSTAEFVSPSLLTKYTNIVIDTQQIDVLRKTAAKRNVKNALKNVIRVQHVSRFARNTTATIISCVLRIISFLFLTKKIISFVSRVFIRSIEFTKKKITTITRFRYLYFNIM